MSRSAYSLPAGRRADRQYTWFLRFPKRFYAGAPKWGFLLKKGIVRSGKTRMALPRTPPEPSEFRSLRSRTAGVRSLFLDFSPAFAACREASGRCRNLRFLPELRAPALIVPCPCLRLVLSPQLRREPVCRADVRWRSCSSASSMTSRLFTPSSRFFLQAPVEISTHTPTTVTENSRIMSTMPRAVPPARA